MISIDEINLLKGQNEALLKQNKDLQKQVLNLNAVNTELKAENERLKEELAEIGKSWDEIQRLKRENELITGMHNSASNRFDKLYNTLQEIKAIAEDGLQSICYKANCATCRCYSKKISNDTLENILNDYFDEDGDFTDTEGDFFEVLQAFIDRERVACNKAQPISEKILELITKAEEE